MHVYWLALLSGLWPAAVVWLLITLPAMAWHEHAIRQLNPPRLLRALLWVTVRVWPYSKLHRASAQWQHPGAEMSLPTRVRSITWPLPGHAAWSMISFANVLPGRLDLGLPARSLPEADAWMAARVRCGKPLLIQTSAGSTPASPDWTRPRRTPTHPVEPED